jgi:hypothetical protein
MHVLDMSHTVSTCFQRRRKNNILSTTRIQRFESDEVEQPAQKYTAKKTSSGAEENSYQILLLTMNLLPIPLL